VWSALPRYPLDRGWMDPRAGLDAVEQRKKNFPLPGIELLCQGTTLQFTLVPGFDCRKCKIFLFSTASRPTVGPTQLPIRWVPGALSPGVKPQRVKLATHLHLMPRSRKVNLYLHSPIYLHGIVLNYAQRQLHLFYL
jgi:hypothetical protein